MYHYFIVILILHCSLRTTLISSIEQDGTSMIFYNCKQYLMKHLCSFLFVRRLELCLKRFTFVVRLAASPADNNSSSVTSTTQLPGLSTTMPPLCVSVNENLASFVLPGITMVRICSTLRQLKVFFHKQQRFTLRFQVLMNFLELQNTSPALFLTCCPIYVPYQDQVLGSNHLEEPRGW